MILTSPFELDSTDIPVCCAGLQLNLVNPDEVTDVRVLVEGTLHPTSQVVRDGNSLYVMGLQAGTEYSLNITLFNIIGAVSVETTVKPLLGELMLMPPGLAGSWACFLISFLLSSYTLFSFPLLHLLHPPSLLRLPFCPPSDAHPHCRCTDGPIAYHVPWDQGGLPPVLYRNVSIASQQAADSKHPPCC